MDTLDVQTSCASLSSYLHPNESTLKHFPSPQPTIPSNLELSTWNFQLGTFNLEQDIGWWDIRCLIFVLSYFTQRRKGVICDFCFFSFILLYKTSFLKNYFCIVKSGTIGTFVREGGF